MRTARQDHALTHPLLTAEALDQSFHRRRQEHGLLLSTILMVTVFDGRPVWKATAAALDRKRQRMSLLEELTPAARLVVENTTWEMLEGVGEPPDSVVVQIDGVILYRRRKLTRLEADALPASFWMAAGSPTRL